jgi:predicted AlkP superfamily phosphohydrolase/phosphomutase
MSGGGPILFVGLDACDPGIARQLAGAGRMPNLARMFERAARCNVRNPYGLFVGALWPTFATGRRADRHHYHCWDEIEIATYLRQLTEPPSSTRMAPFWQTLSDAGRSVAIIDVPHSKADIPLNGIQISEWGCHDRHFGLHTWPPRKAADIQAAFGAHPVLGVDTFAKRAFSPDDYVHRAGRYRTLEEEVLLLDGLKDGVRAKCKLNVDLLTERHWDLFLTIFAESHSIGHQQWYLHDPGHPRFQPDGTRAVGGDPIAQLYSDLDGALGELLAHVGSDATVLVLLSHGMGPHHDGTHLLDETLARLDLFYRGPEIRCGSRAELYRAQRMLTRELQRRVTAFAVPAGMRRTAARRLGSCPEFVPADDRRRQAYYNEPNNTVFGGVRLNLVGREPQGCVRREDVDAVCDRLRDDLLALVNVDTGKPAVRGVERADRWYRRSSDDRIPDLFVDWSHDAPIETVWSPKVGLVHGLYTHWRSGDHLPDGMLLAYGPGIPSGTVFPEVAIEDLGPSMAQRLGVSLGGVDGRSVPWLTGSQSAH